MTDITYDSFSDQLRAAVPGFDRVYDEHLADNGEILPHVLLGALVRFLSGDVELCGAGSTALKHALPLLERGMSSRDPRVQELVAVSFLENLDPGDPSFPAIRRLFGPRLEEQYRKYEETEAKRSEAE
jgi:hypothetical protein